MCTVGRTMVNKKREILLRAYLGFLMVCLLGIAIISRAFYIQTAEGKYYRSLADSLTIYPKKLMAERGNIYSSDGRLLATTLPTFDIRIDFKTTYNHTRLFNEHIDSVSLLLSQMFGDKSAKQYKAVMMRERRKNSRYYLLKRNVSYNQLTEMKQWPLFREGAYKSGMLSVQNDKRLMPFGLLAQRTIGFTNKDGRLVGLEGKFDESLRGTQGQVMVQKISGGVTIPIESKEEIAPQPGHDVYTTIDVELQDVAEDALLGALRHHGAEHGCVVLMEVKTGRIKAIANLGVSKDSTYTENYNYAAGEVTYPGSTFKLATAAALIEDGIVAGNTKVFVGEGRLVIDAKTGKAIVDHDKPETPELTVKRAIEVSSNVAVASLANTYYNSARQKFYNHLVDFGFTRPIDIELPGTAMPILAEPKKWSGVSAAYLAHGYELLITPLHVLTFYNAIANNGTMVKPYLVEKVREYNTTIDSTVTTVLNERICSEKTIKQLQEILVGVVENGTATNLKTDYLHVAGKTGTAVIAKTKTGENIGRKIYQASFCGYFPAETPEYSMIVVINSPSQNGYYGNVVAGSIFKEVADKVYSLSLDMHPAVNKQAAENKIPRIAKASAKDLKSIYGFLQTPVNEVSTEWAMATTNGSRISLNETELDTDVVPDVTGMSMKDALYILENLGLKVSVSGNGNVVRQSITGIKITKGLSIAIELK